MASAEDSNVIQKQHWKHKAEKVLHKRVPITHWIKDYTRVDALSDLIAGVTLGLTLIPQSIAYSSLAGLPPQYGLNSAFIGCFVYAMFGTIKEISIGPTSLMSLITLGYTQHLTPDFVVALCFFVGCVEFLMGVFKLSFLLDFISIPVTSAFQTATSIIIILSQLKNILGVRFRVCGAPLNNIYQLFMHIKETKFSSDFVLGVSCIIFLLSMRKLKDIPIKQDTQSKKILKQVLWYLCTARNFLAVVISAGIAYYFESVGKHPFLLSGHMQPGLPPFHFPNLNPTMGNHTYTVTEVAMELGPAIIVVPTVAVLANVAIAKAFMTGGTIDGTQEMLTLSLCNILGSFVQAMPTCGAFTRSAVASASGVRTPLSGLYSGLMTMFALTFLTPYFHLIPRATLSAVLISAVMFLVDYQILIVLWHANKRELCTVLVTLVSCLAIGVEYGLLVGVLFSICHLVYKWARPHIPVQKRKIYNSQGDVEYVLVTPSIGMPFPAVEVICNHIIEGGVKLGAGVLPVVINCSQFITFDITAAKGLSVVVKDFNTRGQPLIFFKISQKMINYFKHIGCSDIKSCNLEVELEHMLLTASSGYLSSKMVQENGPNKENIHEIVPLIETRKNSSTLQEVK